MRRSRPFRRVDIVVAVAAVLFFLGAAGVSWAVVAGSKHDFTVSNGTSLNKGGACTPCHTSHYAPAVPGIWTRDLSDERGPSGFFQPANPNYLPGATLLCYDCHENSTTVADDNPPFSTTWTSGNEPQDIAFNGTAVGYYETACGQNPASGNLPVAGTPTGGHYWKTEPGLTPNYALGDKIACSLCHDPHNEKTGAAGNKNDAFFRTETWDGDSTPEPLDNAGFTLPLRKSKNSRVPDGADTRDTGREMCATCHGFSDTGSQKSFFSVTVPKPTPNPIVPEHGSGNATACTDCHGHNQIAGCNECHGYPPLVATAFDRVTNPDGQSYAGGAGAHRRHLDALGTTIFRCEICHGPNPGRPGTTWHNQTSGASCNQVVQANVDIMGLTSYWGSGAGIGYEGTQTGAVPPAQLTALVPPVPPYTFTAKAGGGGDQRCFGLACHGGPPQNTGAVFLNWTDDLVDETSGDPGVDGLAVCKWCHDATPARIGAGPVAPNVLGADTGATGVWTTGAWGADVNGHGLAAGNYEKDLVGEATRTGVPAANKQCTVCHDARYTTLALPAINTPIKPHFVPANNNEKRFRDTINNVATIADSADNTCLACHQVAGGPDSASDTGRVGTHGNLPGTNGYKKWEPDLFTRRCRACHEPHGANWNGVNPNPRNLHMLGKWVDMDGDGQPDGGAMGAEAARVDSNADGADPVVNIDTTDLPIITKSSGGVGVEDNSWDDGNNDGLVPPDSICVVCHVTLVNDHSEVGNSVAQGTGHLTVGTQCRLCHQHGDGQPNAFGPLSCYACHGVAPADTPPSGELAGQYWPSGAASKVSAYNYSNDQKGAHRKHIDAIGLQVFGEDATQLVLNSSTANPTLTSFEKQVEVCWFCHYDPGGADAIADPVPHFNQETVGNSPADRVDVLQGSAARYFRKFTTGVHATYTRTNFAADQTGGAYSFVTDSCANLVCHNQSATPAASSTGASPGWNTPPDWSVGITLNCDNTTCHAAPGTYTLAHSKHVGGGVGQKNYRCRECHVSNGANLLHGNGKVEMQAGTTPWLWNNPATVEGSIGGADGFYDRDRGGTATAGDTGFAYKNSDLPSVFTDYNASCNKIYCHGDDNDAGQLPLTDRGSDTTPQWGLASTAACGTCHRAAAATPPGTLAHPTHAGNVAGGGYAIGCQVCHYGTTTNGTMIASQVIHVNGSVEVSFGADTRVNAATSAYVNGDTVMGSGYGNCTNTYCHSKGTDRVAPFTDAASVPAVTPPLAWNGTASCGNCHGDGTANGMPAYADGTIVDTLPKANKHVKHVTASGYGCRVCHWPTTHDNGSAIFATAIHVNGSYEANDDGAAPTLDEFDYTAAAPGVAGTCDNANCHGGSDGISWGLAGPIACDVCHGNVAGARTATDVNDFHWDGTTQSKIGNAASAGEYDTYGHGKAGVAVPACAGATGCHDSSLPHDLTMAGNNPYRLRGYNFDQSDFCNTTCHLPANQVRTHTNVEMTASGGAPKRTWPWLPECSNCHDPHGDGTNLAMIQRELYDKEPFPLNGAAPPVPTVNTNQNLAFTNNTAGIAAGSYADASAYSSICQECHEHTSMVSFKDGGSTTAGDHPGAIGGNPGDCSNCHRHDRAFRPTLCEDCHGVYNSDPALNKQHPGVDNVAGNTDDAPNVMTYWDGSWWDSNRGGSSTKQQGGHGDPDHYPAVACSGTNGCHDIGLPDPSTHLDGVYNSIWGNSSGTRNANTSHLKASFIGGTTPDYSVQLTLDNACWGCHSTFGDIQDMRHERDSDPAAGVILFGTHLSRSNGDTLPLPVPNDQSWPGPYPVDQDISTNASGSTFYAPCVSCHDPHGTGAPAKNAIPNGSNFMMRDGWDKPSILCKVCHP